LHRMRHHRTAPLRGLAGMTAFASTRAQIVRGERSARRRPRPVGLRLRAADRPKGEHPAGQRRPPRQHRRPTRTQPEAWARARCRLARDFACTSRCDERRRRLLDAGGAWRAADAGGRGARDHGSRAARGKPGERLLDLLRALRTTGGIGIEPSEAEPLQPGRQHPGAVLRKGRRPTRRQSFEAEAQTVPLNRMFEGEHAVDDQTEDVTIRRGIPRGAFRLLGRGPARGRAPLRRVRGLHAEAVRDERLRAELHRCFYRIDEGVRGMQRSRPQAVPFTRRERARERSAERERQLPVGFGARPELRERYASELASEPSAPCVAAGALETPDASGAELEQQRDRLLGAGRHPPQLTFPITNVDLDTTRTEAELARLPTHGWSSPRFNRLPGARGPKRWLS